MNDRWQALADRAESAGGKLIETAPGLFRLSDRDGRFVGTMTQPEDEDREFEMYRRLVQRLERGEGLGK